MNQGKLDVVKQEMARVNITILGISELAKFRLKLKKTGKTTTPFRYDLNKIPYDHTVEVTNRFKELDLIECLKDYRKSSRHCPGGNDQDHPQEIEMQKGKMVV